MNFFYEINHKQGEREMKKFATGFAKFLKDEEGLTTVEYAVAGTLIALAVVVAFGTLGNQVGTSISNITSAITP